MTSVALFELILGLLGAALLLSLAAGRLGFPPAAALVLGGMALAAAGHLTPVMGAIGQEAIDVLAVVNALRVALVPRALTDY